MVWQTNSELLCVAVFTVIQIHLQGLLGTIIDGQSSSRRISVIDCKRNKGDNTPIENKILIIVLSIGLSII